MIDDPIKSRFCPSPTGYIHFGNARTALFNYLYAQSQGGEFLLRIEDTDQERSQKIYDDALQEDLRWLGLSWSEGPGVDLGHGPYHQSERQAIYDDYYQRLLASGIAYQCFCSEEQLALNRRIQRAAGQPPRYPGTCRDLSDKTIADKLASGVKPTLRFRVPDNKTIRFTDVVRGEQAFLGSDISDFIIRRANGTSPFLFCNAIDDALMGVSIVLRGEDHLTNTPRQILVLESLALPVPTYGHIALIVAKGGSPLSKRHGSKSITELRQAGYLPQAINNYLARLGHYYEEDQLMSLVTMAAQFKCERLSKSPAQFNSEQLHYWQKEAVLQLSIDEMMVWLGEELLAQVPSEKQELFIATVQPNIMFPQDILPWVQVCQGDMTMSDDGESIVREVGHQYFDTALAAYETCGADLKSITNQVKSQLGVKGKALFQPLRVALTGQQHGPELAKLLTLIEPDQVKLRLQQAQNKAR